MALLQTTANFAARGHTILELALNSPTNRELVDTYHLRLWAHDQLVYDRVHSVRNWQMRHYYVEEIARAFRCVRQLIDQKIQCPNEEMVSPAKLSYLSLVHARLDTDWLTISLGAAHTKRYGKLVHVHASLRQAEKQVGDMDDRRAGDWGVWYEMIGAIILCKPEDAIEFGTRLRDEINEVERTRISLGIPEYDPSYWTE